MTMKTMKGHKTPVVCGWCHVWLSPPEKGSPQGQQVTHGICTACIRQHFPEDAPRRPGAYLVGKLRRGFTAIRTKVGEVVRTGGGPAAW